MSDDAWAFVAPSLTLMRPGPPQRVHQPREVSNALRWIVRISAQRRMLPTHSPPWEAVSHHTRRWIEAGCVDDMIHDLRAVLRWGEDRADGSTVVLSDSRTVQSSPASGAQAGYDGHDPRRGSKIHLAVGHPGAPPGAVGPPGQGAGPGTGWALAEAVQEATGEYVEVAFVDQGSTGEQPAAAAAEHWIALEIVKLPTAKRGFVLLLRRWVIE